MIFSIILLAVTMLVIWRASDGFETASEYLGRNLSDGVRGATINAIGSSMPELFTTFIGLVALHNADGFAFGIGTTAGSAIFNGMIIPAIVIIAVIAKNIANGVEVSRKVILRDGLSLIAAELVLIFLISGSDLHWWHGLILMVTYGVYIAIVFGTMDKEDGEQEEESTPEDESNEESSFLKNLLTLDLEGLFVSKGITSGNAWSLLIVSMAVIGLACAGLVEACSSLATEMGIAPYFIAVVLASAATSVPDTIISYRDAMDGDYDDAVANALGSNIFDVCFALGLPLFVYTVAYGSISMNPETVVHIAELRGMLLLLTVLTFLVFLSSRKLKVAHGVVLIAFYLVFTCYVFGRAYGLEWTDGIAEIFQSLFLN